MAQFWVRNVETSVKTRLGGGRAERPQQDEEIREILRDAVKRSGPEAENWAEFQHCSRKWAFDPRFRDCAGTRWCLWTSRNDHFRYQCNFGADAGGAGREGCGVA